MSVDKSFVDKLGLPEEKELVSSIISISKNLNLNTVVEGVETQKQVEILRSMEAHQIQGYYFSKPRPLDAFFEYYYENLKRP